MGLRFRKSINLGGGFRINLSKSGIGYSYGVKGLRYTKTAKGKERMTSSVPGTGISWSTETGNAAKRKRSESVSTSVVPTPENPAQTAPQNTTQVPIAVKVLAVICGIGFIVYYVKTGTYFGTAVIAGAIMGGISYLALCALYGMLYGCLEAGKKSADIQKKEPPDQSEALHAVGQLKEESFDLPGTHYHKASIAKVADINPDWRKTCKALINAKKENKKIYRFLRTTKKAELVKEPDNPHDKNAVMVLVDGEKVGYISADENLHVIDIMDSGAIEEVSATISGGSYKIVYSEDETKKGESGPYVEVKVKYKG